ncbi:MAG: di-heme oxidoredictase family protein [Myxococcota bacterium]
MMMLRHALPLVATVLVLAGCPGDDDPAGIPDDIFAPQGQPLPTADAAQLAAFERGREVASRRFTAADGLGPQFNVTFCGSCHEQPVVGGAAPRYRNFFLVGQTLGGAFAPLGTSGVQTHYSLNPEFRVTTAEGTNTTAVRNPIPFFGVGLLAEIDEAAILEHADPDDADGDGISGRPNIDSNFVGRFGRKAQTVSIEGFIRGPLFNHAGITSDPLPDARREELPVPSTSEVRPVRRALTGEVGGIGLAQAAAPSEPITDTDGAPDPELSEDDLFDLVSFSMLLAPAPFDEPTPETEEGRALFEAAQCAACHVPTLRSPRGFIPAYSDLLLHDMGPELADGIEAGEASGSEFRTQPLWGVASVGPYLHDGRADTLDEAIRAHGGEAEGAREAYVALSEAEQGRIVQFLESLGGRSQKSPGLIPPDANMPEPGTLGGPREGLSDAELAQFVAGRARFDADFAASEGLGPRFNGDSCRACHFDGAVGGAGPTDVDVTRQGIIENGEFRAPAEGTMLHRHVVSGDRPPMAAEATFIELRQTPAVFGMGLIERIDPAQIMAAADPDDMDADGISGRAHILPDGRLGLLGWKASVPTMQEFARDALFNEAGITLPDEAGQTFGAATDADPVPDPEISIEELTALAFYMANLGAPPRSPIDPAVDAAGAMLFGNIGCASCHTPELTAEGEPVRAFSDFLLHDIAPDGYEGIVDGDAGGREYRTAPLWGLRHSAPYMHDGRAFTVEEAIDRHAAEAAEARTGYMMLGAEDRAALLEYLRSL